MKNHFVALLILVLGLIVGCTLTINFTNPNPNQAL